ncbi:hypothetical protein M404DRAFT_678760 [Pisolithus tinctorius Marx 270]|uniref:GATA-type domain-containing protein n=1 Tax=Pisolithus tinctorius Marx 270 TaxID=870435 RepID=A0A0C3PTG5_PISTI|nr:hypothetical protein M404DRAFT_678760 [Pisolithus tinctorius Marx 270]
MDFEASSFASPASFSDTSSTPRTPSPHSASDMFISLKHHPITESSLFHDSESLMFNDVAVYPQSSYAQSPSLLQELYDQPNDYFIDDQAHYNEWHQHQQHLHFRAHDHSGTVVRRATFPYVRHDQLQQYPSPHLYDLCPPVYHEPEPAHQAIKLEDTPLIVPSQLGYSTHAIHSHHNNAPSYLSPATGGTVAIQHTDDAASKETQYLRRRCFNCHTTEPPSWRRSTLNPGKIVCNKCGLYERTHLRPRPLRFDELRAGGKTRKSTGVAQPDKKGPKTPAAAVTSSPQIKKEQREFGLIRRASVSSSVSSGGAISDWDDNVSVYSSQPPTPGSASGQLSAFSSPAVTTFPIPRSSQSPPADAGVQAPIRLPNAPLSDIASFQQQQPHPHIRFSRSSPSLTEDGAPVPTDDVFSDPSCRRSCTEFINTPNVGLEYLRS